MKRDSDFQLYERAEENFQRKRRRIRWSLFGVNLIFFLFYTGFVLLAMNDELRLSYLMSVYYDSARDRGHILWIPIFLWMFTLIVHFISLVIEGGYLDKALVAQAHYEEERIIEAVLKRMSEAEKRKRHTEHLEDGYGIETPEDFTYLINAETQQSSRR